MQNPTVCLGRVHLQPALARLNMHRSHYVDNLISTLISLVQTLPQRHAAVHVDYHEA